MIEDIIDIVFGMRRNIATTKFKIYLMIVLIVAVLSTIASFISASISLTFIIQGCEYKSLSIIALWLAVSSTIELIALKLSVIIWENN